jgi:hypothetical protein
MAIGLRALDSLLRGQQTTAQQLQESAPGLRLGLFLPWTAVLGAIYGFFMGWYAISTGNAGAVQQAIASTVKIPLLFLSTLLVTFPSLYVFNALVGCRLSFTATLRLLVAAIVVSLAVAASLGPILGFFTVSTKSYSFIVVLNVALLGVAGVIGLSFLLKTLRTLAAASVAEAAMERAAQATEQGVSQPTDEQDSLGTANFIFRVWVVIFGLVGAQMGWVLRPFIGNPNSPFEWFRQRQGNFFESMFHHLQKLLSF